VLGVDQPVLTTAPDAEGRVVENVKLLVHAFDPEGRSKGSHTQEARIVMRPATGGSARFEVLTQTELPPGRYSLRLAAGSQEREKVGSVSMDVEVPKFDARLSLSGVVLTSSGAPVAAPRDALSALMPVIPTSERGFAPADDVEAFVRVYVNGAMAQPVELVWRIRDANDRVVVTARETVQNTRFGTRRSADVRYALPVATLPPGDYLLTLDASLTARSTARQKTSFHASGNLVTGGSASDAIPWLPLAPEDRTRATGSHQWLSSACQRPLFTLYLTVLPFIPSLRRKQASHLLPRRDIR
jgi:hypothetical protein